MKRLGTLQGTGQLVTAAEVGEVAYWIDVYETDEQAISGLGRLRGDIKVLVKTLANPEAVTLRLQDTRTVEVVVTSVDVTGASVKTSGPIPGF